ncbi:MAG: DNRLRE domain-containing protein, partial [Actinobacteria bacterium]
MWRRHRRCGSPVYNRAPTSCCRRPGPASGRTSSCTRRTYRHRGFSISIWAGCAPYPIGAGRSTSLTRRAGGSGGSRPGRRTTRRSTASPESRPRRTRCRTGSRPSAGTPSSSSRSTPRGCTSDWVGDHSNDIVIKVGAYDGGTVASTADHRAQSYLTFPELGLDRSYAHVSGAVLHLFDTWASYCSPEEFDVAPVTQSWTPSGVLSYASAPTFGGVIGRASPNVPNACHNTGADRSVGDGVDVTMSDVSVFNAWANGAADYGLGMFAPNGDTLHWKQFSSDSAEIGGPSLELTYDGAVMLPTVQVQRPANGTPVTTLTPELSAIGSIDGHLDMSGAKFDYQIYDAGGAKVIDSGLVGNSYVVPAGKFQWGKTYLWTVQASDGTDYSINPVWYQLTTQVPQPLVTSSLSQNGGHGFDPSIGNYTTSSTDADVATVGPDLSIVRNFNSR